VGQLTGIQAINDRRVVRVNLRQRKLARAALEKATSYDDWARAALELDKLEGSFLNLEPVMLMRSQGMMHGKKIRNHLHIITNCYFND